MNDSETIPLGEVQHASPSKGILRPAIQHSFQVSGSKSSKNRVKFGKVDLANQVPERSTSSPKVTFSKQSTPASNRTFSPWSLKLTDKKLNEEFVHYNRKQTQSRSQVLFPIILVTSLCAFVASVFHKDAAKKQ